MNLSGQILIFVSLSISGVRTTDKMCQTREFSVLSESNGREPSQNVSTSPEKMNQTAILDRMSIDSPMPLS